MAPLIKKSNIPIIINHNLGIPVKKENTVPESENILKVLEDWLIQKLKYLCDEIGIKKSNIIFDVGIGFGKTEAQNIQILENLNYFKHLEIEIYVGHSRKSFLNKYNPKTTEEKDKLTAKFSKTISPTVNYIRVHNIKLNRAVAKHKRKPPHSQKPSPLK
jgi:dihydropteroate synthase